MANSKKKIQVKRTGWPIKKIIAGFIVGFVVVILCLCLYMFAYDPPYNGAVRTSDDIKVFSHRGFGDKGPDNSLAAATRGITTGADGVDVDAQLTKDGKLVIFHDLSLDRLTDAKGKVGDKTLAELEQLDLAQKYDGKGYETAYVRSFEDFVKSITPEATLMVELKVTSTADTGAEREAWRILKKYDAFNDVILSSFNPLVIHRLESLDSRIQTMYIFMDTNWNEELLAEIKPDDVVDLPWFVRAEWTRRGIRKITKPDYLSVNVAVDENTREHLIQQGWPVFLWTPNDRTAIQQAIAQEPYGIISDRPEEVLRQLGEQ